MTSHDDCITTGKQTIIQTTFEIQNIRNVTKKEENNSWNIIICSFNLVEKMLRFVALLYTLPYLHNKDSNDIG